jgi:chromosome segregation protein
VLEASRRGTLRGIRGTLSELITAPKRFDTAIEVAMGSHLQDIVVDRWHDAEQAIDLLKRSKSGRATFQPLDSIKEPRLQSPGDGIAERAGVHGVAAKLVEATSGVERVVGGLLGRTLVVEDLDTARAVLPRLAGGWSAVTVAGEIVRWGGSVSGGSAVRESGVLGRERELRELPDQIVDLERERVAATERLAELAGAPQRLAEERRELDAASAAIVATRRERTSQLARLRSWLEELECEQRAARDRSDHLQQAEEASHEELAALRRESMEREQELEQARAAREQLIERGAADAAHLAELEAQLAQESQRFAGLEERVRSESRRKTGLLAHQKALAEERSLRKERFSGISGEIEGVAQHVERLDQESSSLAAEQQRLQQQIRPAQQTVEASDHDVARREEQLDEARQRLLDAERARGVSELGVERLRGELAALRQRIFDDLEMENPDELLAIDVEVDGDVGEVEREISRLKERLRRVGYIGEEAVEEFERESERHRFLRAQLDDVEGASLALRALLDDLRTTMRQRFDETFERVAEAFTAAFTTLFGGGTARLVVVANENGAGAGVDIVAQPPGKRLQSLALLSGGERSLTAAALLFAILNVNPTPFVLLDEVDAALDEANIVRFREQLQLLAHETQAVIITHNRGTIEVADSLYGVSMRDDGVSTVLSLRMSEAEQAGVGS